MEKKIVIRVYDKEGNDVTDTKEWYIDKNGCLYYETDDAEFPLYFTEDFNYEILVEGIVVI